MFSELGPAQSQLVNFCPCALFSVVHLFSLFIKLAFPCIIACYEHSKVEEANLAEIRDDINKHQEEGFY